MMHCSLQPAPVSNFVLQLQICTKVDDSYYREESGSCQLIEMLSELLLLGISSFLFNQRKIIFVQKLHVPNKNAVKPGNENMK